ncbi:formate dehydrogenase subunit delta [Bradyrhizobium sp. SYSU BS000235]|uniref:formate dehydrogenase subunit delta n=1 Tax=Bradyrhizobium sp. SYSU BS000235 TaxID=3411332 RepID=UPI003C75C463
MVNQIGPFFKSQGEAAATASTTEHIQNFRILECAPRSWRISKQEDRDSISTSVMPWRL